MTTSLTFDELIAFSHSSVETNTFINNDSIESHYTYLISAFSDILIIKTNAGIKDAIGRSVIVLATIARMKNLTITKQTPGFAKGWPALTNNTVIALGNLSKAMSTEDKEPLQDLVDDLVALFMIWASNHLVDIEECIETALPNTQNTQA